MSFVANPRFKEENFFGIYLIVDTETDYVNVNSLCSSRCLPCKDSIKFNRNRTNKLIEDFISKAYYKHFQQFESWDNLNEIETNDSEILDFFHYNRTSLYYYSKNNYYDNLDYDIFEGYYVNRIILPWFISHFKPHLNVNISEILMKNINNY